MSVRRGRFEGTNGDSYLMTTQSFYHSTIIKYINQRLVACFLSSLIFLSLISWTGCREIAFESVEIYISTVF